MEQEGGKQAEGREGGGERDRGEERREGGRKEGIESEGGHRHANNNVSMFEIESEILDSLRLRVL